MFGKKKDLPILLRKCARHALLLSACLLAVTAHAKTVSPEGRTQKVFAAAKSAVVQIRTLVKGSQSQNSIGSGFYVSDDGLIITNYHVVSSYALEPKLYQMEYSGSNNEHGAVKLLAIDVLHDLALLQRQGGSHLPYLRFQKTAAARGEKLFSLGNPNDLGLSIVEGVNNGLQEHSFYNTLHFTGAINPGMSGGPVVTDSIRLVGINEATMGESRGFLVPAQYASALLARWRKHPVAIRDFQPVITSQLKQHSSALVARLTRKPLPVQPNAGYAVPDAADPYIRCWASTSDDEKLFYNVKTYNCSGRSDVFISDSIMAGSVSYVSMLYRSDRLDAFRFGNLIQDAYDRNDFYDDDPKQFSKFECTDSVVDLNGMPAKAALCLRAYLKYDGLYDIDLRIASLRDSKRALVTKLNLTGVAYPDGMRMVRHYMEALKWNG
jgi:serine protease Do